MANTKGIHAALVGVLMMQAVDNIFDPKGKPTKPSEWLKKKGSCYTADKTRSVAKQLGFKQVKTPVASPQSNGIGESFVKKLKRDYAKLPNRPGAQTNKTELPK